MPQFFRDYLYGISKGDKLTSEQRSELSDWLDSNPNAVDEMIDTLDEQYFEDREI